MLVARGSFKTQVRSTGFSRKTCKFRLKTGLQTCEISFEMGSSHAVNLSGCELVCCCLEVGSDGKVGLD